MKRLDNSDVNIKLDSRIVYLSNFNAKFYTVNAENFFIRKTQDNVISAETEDNDTEYYIKLDWNELVTLGEGVLQYKIVNNIPDSDRADLYFNKNLERTTEYYINSNVVVDPEGEQSYAEIIAELGIKIDTEITRSTSADTVHDEAIQDEVITRQQNVSDLTDLITSASTEIATLSGNVYAKDEVDELIDNINISGYTTIEEFDEACEVTAAALNNLNDRKLDVSAYTPTDLTNYYTKSETSGASQISTALDDKLDVSAYTPTDLTDYYTKQETSGATEISSALSNKLDASAYTPTDLSNYYTKSETSGKTELSTALSSKADSDSVYLKSETSGASQISTALSDKADSSSVYLKSETSGKTELSTALNTKVSQAAFETYSADTVVSIENKANVDDLHEVAFSGDYNDLKNKPSVSPSIPDYWDAGEY